MAKTNLRTTCEEEMFCVHYNQIYRYINVNDPDDIRKEEDIPSDKQNAYVCDQEASQKAYGDFQKTLKDQMIQRYQSLKAVDIPEKGNGRTILENQMFSIELKDNRWGIGVILHTKPNQNAGFQRSLFPSFLQGLKECLLNLCGTVYLCDGPNLSVPVTKEQEQKHRKQEKQLAKMPAAIPETEALP